MSPAESHSQNGRAPNAPHAVPLGSLDALWLLAAQKSVDDDARRGPGGRRPGDRSECRDLLAAKALRQRDVQALHISELPKSTVKKPEAPQQSLGHRQRITSRDA